MLHCYIILHQFAMQREGGCAGPDSRVMVILCVTTSFGNVGTVDVSRFVLNLGLLLHYEVFYVLGIFIVHLVQLC